MPFVRVWVHLVWSTKDRKIPLSSRTIFKIGRFLKSYAEENDIFLDTVNGYEDHIHCLISLKSTQTISDVVKHLKGASSEWINESKLIRYHFNWQKEYFAISVSESNLKKVRSYIKNQRAHHRRQTFDDEMKLFEKLLTGYS